MHYPEMWGFVQFTDRFAGEGSESFHKHPDDEAKWALRLIYYHEKNHFAHNGSYSVDLTTVSPHPGLRRGYSWPPAINITPSFFEGVLEGKDGAELHISHDGRVW
jgi:hypothetical protein